MKKYTPEELDLIFNKVKEIILDPSYKLKIIDLRKYIDEIYPRDIDQSLQSINEIKQSIVGLSKRIKRTEECLGIDFELDSWEENVKYVFIKDDYVRQLITAYYREMLRYQYGTRNHKICFAEFCRLATIQIEFMLNYFFSDKRKSKYLESELKKMANDQFDKAFNKWQKNGGVKPLVKNFEDEVFNSLYDNVPKIPLYRKSKVFFDSFLKEKKIGGNGISFVSNWTANIRNHKSHGSGTTIDPYEENYLSEKEIKELDEWRINVSELIEKYNKEPNVEHRIYFNGVNLSGVDWNDIPEDIKSAFNDKQELRWMNRKPFKDVHDLLIIIASTCAKELSNKTH